MAVNVKFKELLIRIVQNETMKSLVPGVALVIALTTSFLSASMPLWSKLVAVIVAVMTVTLAIWAAPASAKTQAMQKQAHSNRSGPCAENASPQQ
ncbi:hypothetical protein [Rhodanobacter sp. MP1X3]|uniref:hypothetical protein n=1 Tax=Rhodanobacter sp. MP1X3 TaxID=2723086 RepID=UPI00161B322F|nr:hypothetical protein [Rhodanobacter sp. MP1X3]MBB6242601.1 membrane protein YdbS with pleckstrin-like domain [Rhodanobacter sp. MP1X3]